MNLVANVFEADIRVKSGPNRILLQRLDLGRLHALTTHESQGMFHQPAAKATALALRIDGHVGNPANTCVSVESSCDVSEDLALLFVDEDTSCVITGNIGVDVTKLAKAPVLVANGTEFLFDVAVNGNTVKTDRRDLLQAFEIACLKGPDHGSQNRRGQVSCQSPHGGLW
jgi:hypothetical protein